MSACWFCHESVEDAPDAPPVPVAYAVPQAAAATRTAVATAPTQTMREVPAQRVAYVEPEREPRFRLERTILLGVLAGLLVTIGLLAFEGTSTRFVSPAPDAISFDRQDFSHFHFSIDAPRSWTLSETPYRAELRSPEKVGGLATRGMHAIVVSAPFKDIAKQIDAIERSRPEAYRAISFTKDHFVDGAHASVNLFVSDGLRDEQWWIDRGKTMLRVDFWSRPSDDDAPAVNERMIRTLHLE